MTIDFSLFGLLMEDRSDAIQSHSLRWPEAKFTKKKLYMHHLTRNISHSLIFWLRTWPVDNNLLIIFLQYHITLTNTQYPVIDRLSVRDLTKLAFLNPAIQKCPQPRIMIFCRINLQVSKIWWVASEWVVFQEGMNLLIKLTGYVISCYFLQTNLLYLPGSDNRIDYQSPVGVLYRLTS